jgi:hypothetical protein
LQESAIAKQSQFMSTRRKRIDELLLELVLHKLAA